MIIPPIRPSIIGPTHAAVDRGGLPWDPTSPPRPWTPAQLANLIAWYRGDDTITSSGAVTTWSDKSGNARHLTQGTGTARPTLTTRAGQPVLSFDGGDYLQGAFGATLNQPNTIYVVWEATGVATTQVILDGDDGTNRHFIYVRTPGPTVRAGAVTELIGGAPSAGQIYASCFVANGGSSAIYGRSDFVTAGASGAGGSAALDGLTVGANNAGAAHLTGFIWEVIVASGAHNAATRALVGTYFSSRYSGLVVTV